MTYGQLAGCRMPIAGSSVRGRGEMVFRGAISLSARERFIEQKAVVLVTKKVAQEGVNNERNGLFLTFLADNSEGDVPW